MTQHISVILIRIFRSASFIHPCSPTVHRTELFIYELVRGSHTCSLAVVLERTGAHTHTHTHTHTHAHHSLLDDAFSLSDAIDIINLGSTGLTSLSSLCSPDQPDSTEREGGRERNRGREREKIGRAHV